jgi:hypothetical protein
VLSVGNCVPDDIFEKDLQNTSSLFVDETTDTLHAATTSKTPDSWLGDSLDVVAKDFPMTLSATLSKAFASFAASSHIANSKDRVSNEV